jgi:hypothetical protein
MTVADKLRVKQGRAPRAARRLRRRWRMRRAHNPSCLGRRRLGLRRHPQQQPGDARGLRRQGQLAAGNEVELSRLAPDFQHDDANRIAGQRVGGRPQRNFHIGGAHRHEKTRIETEFSQPAHRHRARFNLSEILPYPHQRPMWKFRCHRPARKPRDKTGGRSALPAGVGKYFVHRAQGETALQHRISVGMPERHPAR